MAYYMTHIQIHKKEIENRKIGCNITQIYNPI